MTPKRLEEIRAHIDSQKDNVLYPPEHFVFELLAEVDRLTRERDEARSKLEKVRPELEELRDAEVDYCHQISALEKDRDKLTAITIDSLGGTVESMLQEELKNAKLANLEANAELLQAKLRLANANNELLTRENRELREKLEQARQWREIDDPQS